MIFTNSTSKSVVLAISGTDSSRDAMVDFKAEEIKFLDGFAHRGMAESSHRILREAGPTLKETMQTYPDFRLVITGMNNHISNLFSFECKQFKSRRRKL